eukprot:3495255-Pleurochrysis_carterae.AAC.2
MRPCAPTHGPACAESESRSMAWHKREDVDNARCSHGSSNSVSPNANPTRVSSHLLRPSTTPNSA